MRARRPPAAVCVTQMATPGRAPFLPVDLSPARPAARRMGGLFFCLDASGHGHHLPLMGARRPERHPEVQKPAPRKRESNPRPLLVTLQQLRDQSCWWWLVCGGCMRFQPIAVVPLIIRWGPHEEVDRLRRSARCAQCGHKGANLSMPSWGGKHVGQMPWPERFRALTHSSRPTSAPQAPQAIEISGVESVS